MRFKITIALTLFLSAASAQKVDPKFTFNVELGLPATVANEPFDDIMQGLVCSSLYGQYSLPLDLHVGVGVRYALLTINEFKVPTTVRGQMHSGSAFVKVGWDKFHTERFATDIGVKVGYAQNYFNTDLNRELGVNPIQFNRILIEPTVGLVLSADERNSYRWCLSYCINGFGFAPQHLGLISNEGYEPSEFKKLSQYLVVGFGYTFYFGVKASD